jgi:hypothetical protein
MITWYPRGCRKLPDAVSVPAARIISGLLGAAMSTFLIQIGTALWSPVERDVASSNRYPDCRLICMVGFLCLRGREVDSLVCLQHNFLCFWTSRTRKQAGRLSVAIRTAICVSIARNNSHGSSPCCVSDPISFELGELIGLMSAARPAALTDVGLYRSACKEDCRYPRGDNLHTNGYS